MGDETMKLEKAGMLWVATIGSIKTVHVTRHKAMRRAIRLLERRVLLISTLN